MCSKLESISQVVYSASRTIRWGEAFLKQAEELGIETDEIQEIAKQMLGDYNVWIQSENIQNKDTGVHRQWQNPNWTIRYIVLTMGKKIEMVIVDQNTQIYLG